jgi:hypothetical protein
MVYNNFIVFSFSGNGKGLFIPKTKNTRNQQIGEH